eukprot:jgi/Mesvir1/5163/Mv15301-RA.2
MNKVFWLGYKRALNQEDLWPLPASDATSVQADRITGAWQHELARTKARNEAAAVLREAAKKEAEEEVARMGVVKEAKPPRGPLAKRREKKRKRAMEDRPPSLGRALYHVFRRQLLIGGILKLVHDLLQLTPPLFLNSLLLYLEGRPTNNFMYKIFGKEYGYYAAGALFLVPFTRSLIESQFFIIMFRMGMQVKTVLISLVYYKSLRLSNSARQSKSSGEIVTLMQVDTERVNQTAPFLHTLWAGIFQIVANVGFLLYYIGPSALMGVFVMLLLIPSQARIVRKLMMMQRDTLKYTGKRSKYINEILQGVKVVKAYAWERPLTKGVEDARELELKAMRKRVHYRAIQSMVMLAAPTLIMLATFFTYTVIAGKEMRASTIFTALALFNALRMPLMMYPFVLNAVFSGKVSLTRLASFMNLEELRVKAPMRDVPDQDAINISKSDFQWVSVQRGGGRGSMTGDGSSKGAGKPPGGPPGGPTLEKKKSRFSFRRTKSAAADKGDGKDGKAGSPSGPPGLKPGSSGVAIVHVEEVPEKKGEGQGTDEVVLKELQKGEGGKGEDASKEGGDAPSKPSENGVGEGAAKGTVNGEGQPHPVENGNGVHAMNGHAAVGGEEGGKANGVAANGATSPAGATEDQEPFKLKNVNLTLKRGELLAVVGPVASGKSSLAAAILGEMDQKEGDAVAINGKVAYCAQEAWILNATLRDNILFGLEYEEERYQQVIKACALEPDLKVLPAADLTEIGERGINLSGGQKQRVSLARAAYSNADVILLDDPLSAVDAHVGSKLFLGCIAGMLKGRSILFITNQLQFVPYADAVVVMKQGEIVEKGTYKELMEANGEFAALMRESGSHVEEQLALDEEKAKKEGEGKEGATIVPIPEEGAPAEEGGARAPAGDSVPGAGGGAPVEGKEGATAEKGGEAGAEKKTDAAATASPSANKGALITKENRVEGWLSLHVYKVYWTVGSSIVPLLVILLYVLVQVVDAFNRFWLSFWTEDKFDRSLGFYLGIYAGLGFAYTLFVYLRTLAISLIGLWTARIFHERLLHAVMRAPMSFFDTTPVGRILNRFGADQSSIDDTLPFSWNSLLNMLFQVLSTIVSIAVVTPYFLPIFFPLCILYAILQNIYRRSARELKRLESLSKSPMYQQFTETLSGLSTIRAYRQEDRFIKMSDSIVDTNNISFFMLKGADRWLSIRLELLGVCVVFSAAILALVKRNGLYAGLAGVSIDFALQITSLLSMLVRTMTETENLMNAPERSLEYQEGIKPEAPLIIEGNRPPPEWPHRGDVEVEHLSMRYRKDLPLVLKDVNIFIDGGDKVGVVGRTGSGKSSLMLVLFRLVEPAEGRIVIDDIDTSTIGLEDLRSRISIIPQDPVLFSGTVRSNIDPFNRHTDEELWTALERAHLKEKISARPKKLDATVAEYGENFSVGEKQLMCLARVLLRNTKILVMDEATSSVDYETDQLIQATVRDYLSHATLIIIAHRLHTVIDSHRIVLLDHGQVVENDAPAKLLERQSSRLSALVADTGEANTIHLKKTASMAYERNMSRKASLHVVQE